MEIFKRMPLFFSAALPMLAAGGPENRILVAYSTPQQYKCVTEFDEKSRRRIFFLSKKSCHVNSFFHVFFEPLAGRNPQSRTFFIFV
jgi:hypothetical protein